MSKQRNGSDIDSEDVDMDSSSWCFAAFEHSKGPAGTLLVDSGAGDHICHPEFAKEFLLKKGAGVRCARQPIISSPDTSI